MADGHYHRISLRGSNAHLPKQSIADGPHMSAPNPLPIEARRAAWDALWRRLLAPVPDDDRDPNDPDSEDDTYDESAGWQRTRAPPHPRRMPLLNAQ